MKEMKDEGDRGRRTKEGGEAEPSGEASGSFVHRPCPAVGLTLPEQRTHARPSAWWRRGTTPPGLHLHAKALTVQRRVACGGAPATQRASTPVR